jgi:glutathione synthase
LARQILFIDSLEKLSVKKDSSLLMAHTYKELGIEVYLLFEKDFYVTNKDGPKFRVYDFDSSLEKSSFYLADFKLSSHHEINLKEGDVFHMRIDPPFDTRYLRYLWMLRHIKTFGVKVTNDPDGVLLHNEKMTAYKDESALESYIGMSSESSYSFLKTLKEEGIKDIILKPLDLYQGIDVIKMSLDDLEKVNKHFDEKTRSWEGPGIIQPFNEAVKSGEIRALFYKNKEIGSIIKVPLKGEYLANIARGASFEKTQLNERQFQSCEKVATELSQYGIDFIAFDILGDSLNEVNITCPGLLVEVSEAHSKNLAKLLL